MKKFYSQNKYTIIGYFFMIVSSLILSLYVNNLLENQRILTAQYYFLFVWDIKIYLLFFVKNLFIFLWGIITAIYVFFLFILPLCARIKFKKYVPLVKKAINESEALRNPLTLFTDSQLVIFNAGLVVAAWMIVTKNQRNGFTKNGFFQNDSHIYGTNRITAGRYTYSFYDSGRLVHQYDPTLFCSVITHDWLHIVVNVCTALNGRSLTLHGVAPFIKFNSSHHQRTLTWCHFLQYILKATFFAIYHFTFLYFVYHHCVVG